jgi:Na+/H+ antiporter NhaD/arsenite permease-like protein
LVLLLVVAIVISAFMNNITVVVIFIPVIQALAVRFNQPAKTPYCT